MPKEKPRQHPHYRGLRTTMNKPTPWTLPLCPPMSRAEKTAAFFRENFAGQKMVSAQVVGSQRVAGE
jgi:hypothetical protein